MGADCITAACHTLCKLTPALPQSAAPFSSCACLRMSCCHPAVQVCSRLRLRNYICTVQMTARRLPLLLLRATRPPPPPLPPAAADPTRRDSQAARPRRAPRRQAAVMALHPQLPPPLMVRKFRVQHQGRDGRYQYVINYCFQQDCLADGHASHMYVLQLVVKGFACDAGVAGICWCCRACLQHHQQAD